MNTIENYLSVNDYLDSINAGLAKCGARIIGEVTDAQIYPDRSYLFFKIKDKDNPAVLTCFMWKNDYSISGVKLDVGTEIIVFGTPSIYKPLGRFSFNAKTIELVGEGQLKKAYDELKAKLEKEGLFKEERKRLLPLFPQKIGLITSKDGAAIGDFQVNLGRFGFKVLLVDSRVEGQLAVPELLKAIKTLKNKDIEILVLIRGGGSLESLLPFNNETLVREIVNFPVPTLVGVGHEKDISLIGLVADKMVSTPTATARELNKSWEQAINKIELNERKIFGFYKDALIKENLNISDSFSVIKNNFQLIFDNFSRAEEILRQLFVALKMRISEMKKGVSEYPVVISKRMLLLIKKAGDMIISSEKLINSYNPEHQLKLGYSIISMNGKLIRKINQIKKGQIVNVRVEDGNFDSEVKIINN
ncbi:exodeoxyribonuclease VII large subunit [Candidatus Wolfebacteria bacterium]|nr:exodeoxyribonuclease VII large subunit [Candidatus Wolfebacteria bacterium]